MKEEREYYYPLPFLPWLRLWKEPPEHSLHLRLLVLATVTIAILAIMKEEGWPDITPWILLGTAAGSIISWLRRQKNNWWIKLSISGFMIIAAIDFFRNLLVNPYDPRIPIANLLLWLQVLHSYDLPSRKDLNYTLFVSLILICVASVLSIDITFGIYLILYLFVACWCLIYSYYSQLQNVAHKVINQLPTREILKMTLNVTAISISFALIFFIFIPRIKAMKIRYLPFSIHINFPTFSDGRIINPGYPSTNPLPVNWIGAKRIWGEFNPNSYFGFTSYLDLNYRGRLSDKVVLKVKTDEATYWKGLNFDFYTGQGWTLSNNEVEWLHATTPPFSIPRECEYKKKREVIQIYSVEDQLPNLIFSAYQPYQVFFPAETIFQDTFYSLRSPFPLQKGIIYSAISYVPVFEPEQLRESPADEFPNYLKEKYLQLPEVIPERVKDLSQKLTSPYKNNYDKVLSIINFLQNNYTYDLDIPPIYGTQDATDHFLFTIKKGYCEQFATALAVLARISGIPARLVVGYTSGTFNPFTMVYEVRGSDAHAWVEIYFPNQGWVSFDPSPGYCPVVSYKERNPWMLFGLKNYIGDKISAFVSTIEKFLWPTLDKINLPYKFLLLVGIIIISIILIAKTILSIYRIPSFPRHKIKEKEKHASFIKEEIRKLYLRTIRLLEKKGYPRQIHQTPYEYIATLNPQLPLQQLSDITNSFIITRYSQHTPSWEELENFKKIYQNIRQSLT